MITDERMASFIQSFDSGNTEFLDLLEKKALEDKIPIIRPASQNLLKLLLKLCKPESILEVGTAVGFSAILFAEYSDEASHITTIENYAKRITEAKKNFAAFGRADKITLLEGDAALILKELADAGQKYDFIFMDAAKGQYINFLPEIMRMLKPGGLLISDNVLQDGDIIESRFAVIRRNRTIHARMRKYLYTITHMEELTTSILPLADGMTVSVRN